MATRAVKTAPRPIYTGDPRALITLMYTCWGEGVCRRGCGADGGGKGRAGEGNDPIYALFALKLIVSDRIGITASPFNRFQYLYTNPRHSLSRYIIFLH